MLPVGSEPAPVSDTVWTQGAWPLGGRSPPPSSLGHVPGPGPLWLGLGTSTSAAPGPPRLTGRVSLYQSAEGPPRGQGRLVGSCPAGCVSGSGLLCPIERTSQKRAVVWTRVTIVAGVQFPWRAGGAAGSGLWGSPPGSLVHLGRLVQGPAGIPVRGPCAVWERASLGGRGPSVRHAAHFRVSRSPSPTAFLRTRGPVTFNLAAWPDRKDPPLL